METKAINTKLKGHARVDVADATRVPAVMGTSSCTLSNILISTHFPIQPDKVRG